MSKSSFRKLLSRLRKHLLVGSVALGSLFGFDGQAKAQQQSRFAAPAGQNQNFSGSFQSNSPQLGDRSNNQQFVAPSTNRSPRIQPSGFGQQVTVNQGQSGGLAAGVTQANIRTDAQKLFRSYTIQETTPQEVIKHLRQLGQMIEVVEDAANNRIIVNATAEHHRMVEQVIERLKSPQRQVTPASNIKSIRSFNVSTEIIRSAANELSQLYVDKNRIIVAADETVGKLMVFATERDYEEVATYLNRKGYLKSRKVSEVGKPGVQTHQLRNIDWRTLEAAIFRGWGNTLKISVSNDRANARIQIPTLDQRESVLEIDRRNNRVQVRSAGSQLIAISRLITLLDQPLGREKIEIIKTKPEAIDQVQSTVSMFKFAALQQDANPKTTSAIVGKAKRNGVYAIYQDQNPQENTGNNQGQSDDDSLGPIGRVEIITIPGTDIIILKGDPKDVERVRKLIEQIEKTSDQYKPQIEVLPLKHVDNIAVQTIADEVYTNFYEPSLGETSITALVKPNALLLVGTPQGVKQAREIIEKLDVQVESKTQFNVFRIKHMSAVDLENRLRAFYQGQSTQGIGANAGGANQTGATQGFSGEGLAPRIRLASDYRSNALFVHASPRDMEEIAKFVAEIDVESAPDGPEDLIQVIRLKNSTAAELAPVLQDILTGQLQGSGQSTTGTNANQFNQANNLNNQQFSQVRSAMLALRSLDPSGKIVRSTILFDTRITADENSNSLIIKAPKGSMDLIKLLVEQLDQLPDVESRLKVFELENAAAPQIVETIQNLFETTQGGGGGGAGGAGGTNIVPLETGGFESTIVSLRLAADARSNTIIAAGSQGDLNIIEALVTRLDEDIESKYVHKLIRLQNTTADVVQEALTGWLDGRSDTLGADPRIAGTGDGALETVKRAISVQAETESNSLIVSAHKEYIHIIENMIRDIDFKKQVVIQAIIAEVQLSDTFEYGIEWGVQDSMIFDRGLGATPIGFPFNQSGLGNTVTAGSLGLLSREDVAGQVLSNLNVGRTNADLGYGGLVMSAGNESINVLLRALDDKSKVDILSRPQITTMENIQAFVQVGQDLPYVTGVDNDNTAGGTTTFATDFLELGVTLSVTPRVRPDGEIWLRVDVSNSSVADGDGVAIQTTAAGGVVFQPIINDQTLQTDVTARSGQTIVLGGLIQSVKQDVVRGIPFLGNLPGIGRMFRFESEQNTRTELFVILRPIVIDSPEDRDMLMQVESARMNWCLGDVIDLHGPVFEEENLAGSTDTVYPDRTPTGYHQEADNSNRNNGLNQKSNQSQGESLDVGSLAPLNNDLSQNRGQNRFNQMPLPNQQFGTTYRQDSNTGGQVQPTSYQSNQPKKKKGIFPFNFK